MFKAEIDDRYLENAAYIYLHPYQDLLMQVVLQTSNDNDLYNLATGSVPDIPLYTGLVEKSDFMARQFCYKEEYPNSPSELTDYKFALFPTVQVTNYRITKNRDLIEPTP